MLVTLRSPEGKRRLEEAGGGNGCALQHEIVDSFRKQRGNTVCGLASLAVLLTARKRSLSNASAKANGNDNPKPSSSIDELFVDEDDVYPMAVMSQPQSAIGGDDDDDNVCGGSDIVLEKKIRTSGMTLDQMRSLAKALPTTEKAIAFFPSIPNDVADDVTITTDIHSTNQHQQHRIIRGTQHLRKLLQRVLSEPPSEEGIVLNYHMSTLGQVPFGGHLSPVAAYHAPSDSLLVMDVWHTQTEPVWASLQCVWMAISKPDSESEKQRGLLQLVHSKVV